MQIAFCAISGNNERFRLLLELSKYVCDIAERVAQPTYKIATVQISRRAGSTDAEGFPLTSSNSSGPERTVSLVLPDSPTREAASAGVRPFRSTRLTELTLAAAADASCCGVSGYPHPAAATSGGKPRATDACMGRHDIGLFRVWACSMSAWRPHHRHIPRAAHWQWDEGMEHWLYATTKPLCTLLDALLSARHDNGTVALLA